MSVNTPLPATLHFDILLVLGENKQPVVTISKWSHMRSVCTKYWSHMNVTYLTVCQDPKPVCTVKFGNKGMHRKSVT